MTFQSNNPFACRFVATGNRLNCGGFRACRQHFVLAFRQRNCRNDGSRRSVRSATFPRGFQICCSWGKLGSKQVRQQSSGRLHAAKLLDVTPVNPKAGTIEGIDALACLSDLNSSTSLPDLAVSIITPPAVTTKIVQEAHADGISRIWMQPGSESAEALKFGADQHDHGA